MNNAQAIEVAEFLEEHHKFQYEKLLAEKGHSGDCTDECHTCRVCLHQDFWECATHLIELAKNRNCS